MSFSPQRMKLPFSRTASTLLATLGTEPQVVTATLDLLQKSGETAYRVIVMHTVSPEERLRAALLSLEQAFRQPPYHPKVALELVPFCDPSGKPLEDIHSAQDVQSAFRELYRQARRIKAAGERIHLQIAGGRKPLAIYGMVVAQLLFEDGDRLWYLVSSGDFLSSKRLHPGPGDDATLVEIPVLPASPAASILFQSVDSDDPTAALELQKALRLKERLDEARAFVRGALTPAEGRVVELLVREGLGDLEIGERLALSPRTVEQHLRSAYTKAAAHWDLPPVNRAQLISLLNLYYSMTPGKNTGNPG